MEKEKKKGILDHILGGIGYMLPCVVAGGILMGVGFMLDNPTINPENYGFNTPTASFFSEIGGQMFGFMLPVLSAGIAYSIAKLGAIPAGLMAGAIIKGGDSGFLGALVVGFIAGYVVLTLEKLLKKVPESLNGLKELLLIPLCSVILVGAGTIFLVEPLVGQLNTLLNNFLNSLNGSSQVFLGSLLGGMQSVDMGGPINKTAYLFATASLTNGQYVLMSAVLAGGIVPPYVTALTTTIFKNKFTKEERARGLTNYIVGLAGITETGIPFLVSDPIRVVISCVTGSAIAGGLSIYLGCSVMAPFGGIFILPLNSNPIGFLIAIGAGILVGTLILGFSKKTIVAEAEKEYVLEEKI